MVVERVVAKEQILVNKELFQGQAHASTSGEGGGAKVASDLLFSCSG